MFGKSGKRFIKLNKVPLTRKQALDRGAFAVEHTTSRTFKVLPTGRVQNLGAITKREQGTFKKTRGQLRKFKIVKGKRKAFLRDKFIERVGFAISTPGEKAQLKLSEVKRCLSYR